MTSYTMLSFSVIDGTFYCDRHGPARQYVKSGDDTICMRCFDDAMQGERHNFLERLTKIIDREFTTMGDH